MAIPRSANERIRRKLRKSKKKKDSKLKDIDLTGRIEVKKSGNNDPRRNRNMSEEFLRFYKGNDVDDPYKFSNLINKMIDIAVEAGGNVEFPFKLSRLREMNESIGK